jgi:pimeloyl-ACP methyl ester carboxylesterase
VVICHGFKGFKNWGFFPYLAERIARAGMTAVTFNFSGSGVGPDGESFSEPERFGHATITGDTADVDTVCRSLLEGSLAPGLATPSALGVFGHSRGGAAALLYEARHPECRALVTWAAIASLLRWDEATVSQWRAKGKIDVPNMRTGDILPLYTDYLDDLSANSAALDLERAAGEIAVPWLIVHGADDESVSPADAEKLFGAATRGSAELKIVDGGSHTLGARHPWAGSTPQLDAAMDMTVEWFSRYLF